MPLLFPANRHVQPGIGHCLATNSATSSAADPVTTNTFKQPADAATFSLELPPTPMLGGGMAWG